MGARGGITKPWGIYYPLHDDTRIEVARAEIRPGGFCSLHLHERKWNHFLVVSGAIVIQAPMWLGGPGQRAVALHPGESFSVPPNTLHRFRSSEGAVVIETYWPAEGQPLGVGEADIVRREDGGSTNFYEFEN